MRPAERPPPATRQPHRPAGLLLELGASSLHPGYCLILTLSAWAEEKPGDKAQLRHGIGDLGPTGFSFLAGQGLQLTGGSFDRSSYDIEISFSFSNVSGYRKVIDFKNRIADSGLYVLSGALNFFPRATGDFGAIVADDQITVRATRDSATNTFTAFLNGQESFSFDDTSMEAVFDPSETFFFLDDAGTGLGETSAGFVDFIRIRSFSGTPIHTYELNGSFADSMGGPDLVPAGIPSGAGLERFPHSAWLC